MRGRPKVRIDEGEVMRLARLGLPADEIARALGISRASFFRWAAIGNNRARLNQATREGIAAVLQAQYDAALRGDVASCNAVIRRLERRRY